MNKVSRLSRNLRRFFGGARILIAVVGLSAALILIVLSFRPSASRDAFFIPLFTDDMVVEQPGDPTWEKNPLSENPDFRLNMLRAGLRVNLRTSDAALSSTIRYTVLPRFVVGFFLSWIMVGLLRDLCARAEKGEVFSEDNLTSLRNLGAVYFARAIVDSAFSFLAKLCLNPHLPLLPIAGSNLPLRLYWNPFGSVFDLILGLLVVLLAEAFREGLALKKENDLTV